MLLILAAVSLSAVFSDKGIFSRAEESGAKYNEAKAREVLETVLLADGQYEKNINPDYNQDDFLDELIKKEIPGSDVKGDVAIIGGWGFELDRTVPKIGRGLGRADKLIFPTLNATAELASDKKNATINITAKEEKNGINKIEIWLLGEKIKEYTYDNVKTEITVNPPYIATQNGKYTIKAYGELMESKTVEVTGIVASVKFEPNGNEEWKKSHSTVVTIEETADKVETAKYVWTNSVTTPEDSQFLDTQTFNSGDTITGGNDNMTGTYYLWTMLETKSGNKAKRRSEGFNFDNEGPNITSFTAEKYSETGITLSVTAQDTKSGIVKFEFYIDDEIKNRQECENTTENVTKNINITGLTTGTHTCKVIVYDKENNYSTKVISATTKLYAWEKWSATPKYTMTIEKTETITRYTSYTVPSTSTADIYSAPILNEDTGVVTFNKTGRVTFYNKSSYLNACQNKVMDYDTYAKTYHVLTGVTEKNSNYASNVYDWTKTYDVYSYTVNIQSYSKGTVSYGVVTATASNSYPPGRTKRWILVCTHHFKIMAYK